MGDYAAKSRELLADCHFGVLSTNLQRLPGHPFGSLVNYALDGAGLPLLLISRLAVHTENLVHDPRASLLVFRTSSSGGAATAKRLTLIGEIRPVPAAEEATAKAIYVARHPEAVKYVGFGDFAVYRLAPAAIYFVDGFGEMGWISKLT